MSETLDRLLVAFAYLTRIPLGRPAGRIDAAGLGRAAPAFPVAGAIVGGLAAFAFWVADELELGVAPILAILVSVAVTGGFHERGLARTADALGHAVPARRLEAMRAPGIGALGTLALIFGVILRITPLSALRVRDAVLALIAGHVLARWATLPLAHFATPARPASPRLVRVERSELVAGTILALAIAVPLLVAIDGVAAIVALAVAAAMTAASGWSWRRAFGGVTGATYGATNQLVEVAVYVGIIAGL